MEDRVSTMQRIKSASSTHDCPSCQRMTYCAMEDGKSASTCWCMTLPKENPMPLGLEKCLCKACLTSVML